MNKNVEIRKCLFSGEEFIPRRNNQLRNELKLTNNQLIFNYKICKELLNKNKSATVHREFLKGKGFDFRFFTNLTENKARQAIPMLYMILRSKKLMKTTT